MSLNRKMPMVDPSRFAMVPRADVPRSTFKTEHTHKTTFNAGYLVPILVDEVLPGDVHKGDLTIFARLSNLIFPLMDNMEVETFFFFVPNRLVWSNWQKFMGEQANPTDSTDYTIPVLSSPTAGFIVGGIADHFGLPTVGQVAAGQTVVVNALPFRAYNLIFNEWFRDQNLMNSVLVPKGDGPDNIVDYNLELRAKKHDYFTACLPWPEKGGVAVAMPIGGIAPVKTDPNNILTGAHDPIRFLDSTGSSIPANEGAGFSTQGYLLHATTPVVSGTTRSVYPSNLYADLASATGATINSMRLAAATQQFLEKDARGGTRYTELLKNHFGVDPEDARLQRPEYIGGGRTPIQTQAMPQTSNLTGAPTPLGSLAGQGIITARHSYRYHATEHGHIIGLVQARADVTYQQGLHKMWSRRTKFDLYWPTFANLGEQVVKQQEIFCTGLDTADDGVFGYQERWAEYRYYPSQITSLFRSTAAGNIDEWHLAQQFAANAPPTLNATFIRDGSMATLSRALAAAAQANNLQILFDSVFNISRTRPMPTFSVPGLTRF